MRPRPTIVDVARRAGVGVSTASDALNGRGRVSEATRARVSAAAGQLGYRANRSARGLQTGTAMAIGLHFGHTAAVPAGEFFLSLLNGAAEAAADAGYGLLVASTLSTAETTQVDGLVIVDPADPAEVTATLADGMPLVTIGRVQGTTSLAPSAPWVDVDHGAAMRTLLDHMAEAVGDGPAWLVSLPQRLAFVTELELAFESWCDERGRAARVVAAPDHPPAAAATVRAALDESDATPALVATVLDRQAVGAHRALGALGAAGVPLGAASDGDMLAMLDPPVSAVALDGDAHGRAAIEMLLGWLASGERPASRLLTAELRCR